MNLNERTKKLTQQEIDEFFDEEKNHLGYRLRLLMTEGLTRGKITGDYKSGIEVCLREASTIACRMFIEFLGLGIIKSELNQIRTYRAKNGESHDVKVVDLGGNGLSLILLLQKK